ncbi:DNA excision repair protein ERCC-6-like 2 isoform X2 [Trachemys scripta elegans]|uniref:DNA excision repair protein ERCC-6-like 2 isoform X2 n=1 Tax=Trachemys scripta elegans TaxID=31138 RepID=UPI00155673BA|nr:DNA excision repair protein ERCC-6-like 2 isoform X2 [Trachemys scripta elegans]
MCDDIRDRWHAGQKCLAPSPESGKLCEATIKSVETDKNGTSFAIVSFLGSEEKNIIITKLCKARAGKDPRNSLIFDDEDLEKPFFPDQRLPSPAVAFELSVDGDCIPYTINRYLRDYQRDGVQFLYGHYARKRGCILGDDMGLGKTIQVISFLAAVLCKKGTREDIENNMPEFLLRTMKKEPTYIPKKTFLIVAPLSVLYNWKDELDTWGYFRVAILHGSRKDNELSRIKQGKYEVALTTYETLRLCLDELNSLEWSAVIVDEAHRIKNPKAQITQTMKALKCNVRIGLTGTILQNNMKELWCVVDWAIPGLLGSRTHFKKEFSDPVEHGQRHTATKRELATGRKAMQKLARKMSGWFLRRTKAFISDQLPKKEDRTNAHGETMRALYFSYLTILRKVANHAALLQTENTSKLQEEHIKRVCNQVFSKFPDFVQLSKDAAFETISDPKYSGKMKVLQQLLNHFRKNKDKVLLFSFSTKLLDVLEQYCMASGLDYRRLDGNTKSEDRVRIVREFNSTQDVNICLVSTMAGGLGLNFVGANVVILFDPTWNPANDLQAIDRAYRIGQYRDVKVFRLISLGTVEEMMYLRQVYKQQLHCAVVGSENAKRYFEAVQGSKEHQGELFGIHNLFKLRTQGSCLTKDILEREGQVEAGVMTATTWLKEEPPSCRLEMHAEPGCEEDKAPLKSREQLEKEEFDFYSDFSDDELVGSSKTKKSRFCNANDMLISQKQLTLMQCGFPKLLERGTKATEVIDSNGASDQESTDALSVGQRSNVDVKCIGLQKSRNYNSILRHQRTTESPNKTEKQDMRCVIVAPDWPVSSDSEGKKDIENKNEDQCISKEIGVVMETEGSSEESDDIIFPSQVPAHQETAPAKNVKRCEAVSEKLEGSDTEKTTKHTPNGDSLACKQSLFRNTGSVFTKTKSWKNAQKITTYVKGTSDISDESDDLEIPIWSKSRNQKAFTALGLRQKCDRNKEFCNSSKTVLQANKPNNGEKETDSQNIGEFSSSEDDSPVKKIHLSKQSHKHKKQRRRIQFDPKSACRVRGASVTVSTPSHSRVHKTSRSKRACVNQEENVGSLDNFLDGVQEVAYIHSNQNVVGSSKAENQMSNWAVRDVFELKQFSQLPANIAVYCAKREKETQEAISAKKNIKREQQISDNSKQSHLCIEHPAIQKKKKVHRVGATTFLIGETPKSIRRKQFEEMVSHFNMASVEELAEYIAKATSEARQKMLRDFYAGKYPELEDLFPVKVPVHVSDGYEEEEVFTSRRKRRAMVKCRQSRSGPSAKDSPFMTAEICSQKRHKGEAKQFHNDFCIQDAVCLSSKDKQLSTVNTQNSISGRNSQPFKDFMATDSVSSKSEIIEVCSVNITKGQQDSKGTESPRKRSLSQSENRERETQTYKKNSFVDLLGDTSVLNDLFKSNGNRPTELPRRSLSGPAEKAKERPKDFWDVLNEQNDESLRKLTDMAVIEELCERAPPVALTKKKEVHESSLWKQNDNFLWKKYNLSDSDESTSGAHTF